MLENEYSIVKQKSSKTIYSKEKSLKTIRHDTQKQDDSFLSREMHLKNISITKFENDKDSTKNICNFKKDNGNNNSVLKSKCGMPSILDISSLNKNESIQQKSLNCFKNQSIRRKFIINIVGLVIIMLLIVSVTVSITCIPSIRKWLSSPENKLHIYGIFYITFALWVIVYLVTVCYLQMILNDERNKIGPNDTVFAVIILFTDIVHIFMNLIIGIY
ncbi:Hypothetical protein SRAE_2000129700 [Strongyloides ratti]|uniref:Uncharacterized protein n=1 Tax=Strongyloides ratti TaxID=34506 RepID=A0A090MY62_STRRB|nr:Hypothetical protein SRAE_2000129700 [Strongyloides ratti]CEF66629.1 Hypothetical protein SRAE_2000129700 [Strongyloides ratti]